MFKHISSRNKEKRNFDEQEKNHIGRYIYALKDPRDSKIFYIGQGIGNRMFDHFNEAEEVLKGNRAPTSKTLRIIDIWDNDEDVDCFFITVKIPDEVTANKLESAAADAVSLSQNGPVLNDNATPDSSLLTIEQLKDFACKPVNPTKPYTNVFVFPIHNALAEGRDVYDACRSAWTIAEKHRNLASDSIAVALAGGIAKGAFRIRKWILRGDGKCEFEGESVEDFCNSNFQRVINVAMGYWQRGNPLVVEFDGAGKFRIKRGSSNENWYSCEI